jgi:uncharacterized membrane protein HdeD (DUF308 family)
MAFLAVVSFIGGVLALIYPLLSTLAVTLMAGWAFIVLGIVEIIHSFRVTGWGGFLWALGLGVLTLLVGLSVVFNPLAGMVSLTILIAAFFLAMGVVKVMYALKLRPLSGWGWVIFSGIVSIVLGVMIMAGLPQSSLQVLGILLGIELISNGVLYGFIAAGLRRA